MAIIDMVSVCVVDCSGVVVDVDVDVTLFDATVSRSQDQDDHLKQCAIASHHYFSSQFTRHFHFDDR